MDTNKINHKFHRADRVMRTPELDAAAVARACSTTVEHVEKLRRTWATVAPEVLESGRRNEISLALITEIAELPRQLQTDALRDVLHGIRPIIADPHHRAFSGRMVTAGRLILKFRRQHADELRDYAHPPVPVLQIPAAEAQHKTVLVPDSGEQERVERLQRENLGFRDGIFRFVRCLINERLQQGRLPAGFATHFPGFVIEVVRFDGDLSRLDLDELVTYLTT